MGSRLGGLDWRRPKKERRETDGGSSPSSGAGLAAHRCPVTELAERSKRSEAGRSRAVEWLMSPHGGSTLSTAAPAVVATCSEGGSTEVSSSSRSTSSE